jgi:hypothetical protein
VNILTGNDLGSGDVVCWDGSGWSRDVNDAVDVDTEGDTIIAAEEATRRVNAGYAVVAARGPDGVRPAHIKDRIRAFGPTVRLGLTVKPGDIDAANRVI